jgi:small conductance mechanosensitive channel
MEQMMETILDWGTNLVSATLILVAGWIVGNWLSRRIENANRLDTTLASFLGGFSKYTVFTVAIISVLGQFGIQTASLLAVLGAAGLAIGLALQGTLGNVAAGTMLLILRPFKVGDYIEFGGVAGTVKALGLFGTELSTSDNIYIFAPNGSIWKSDIYNYSRNDERRQDFTLCISYSDDIDKAVKIISKVIEKEERILQEEGKEPKIIINNMGDFSVDIIARIWTERTDVLSVKSDMNKVFKEALENGGITIPFPTRTIEMVDSRNKSAKAA